MVEGNEIASQDALHSASVKPCEDVAVHSELPPLSQEEEAPVCLLHNGLSVKAPCEFLNDVDSKKLGMLTLSTDAPLMMMGPCSLSFLLKSSVSSLVLLVLRERFSS